MLIRAENLSKEFVTGEVITKVLRGVSLSIDQGEFVAIMGPSGSGKSTLMHILGLLDHPTGGSYFFADREVGSLDDEESASLRNSQIGFVFQSFNLLPRTTVLENVMLPLLYMRPVPKDASDRAKAVLDRVGLSHRLDYYTNRISGGEKQRVAIARALITEPSVIFADEPTGNLDSKSGTEVMRFLQELNEAGNTIILVTHETYTSEHAKRIISLRDGEIVSDKQVEKRRFAKEGEILK
ncbi:MAG: ABC transporter ATP-binding protein [Patescibacteria group bacterium]|nr:MAG: ABC transporter ATP-binding protein [Patescibacteria group bacterium]